MYKDTFWHKDEAGPLATLYERQRAKKEGRQYEGGWECVGEGWVEECVGGGWVEECVGEGGWKSVGEWWVEECGGGGVGGWVGG